MGMMPIKMILKISLSHSYQLLVSFFTSSQNLGKTMRYYLFMGIILCFHNLCVLYDIRTFYLKYGKILYAICYTPYSSIATHSALNFSINILLDSLYSAVTRHRLVQLL